MPVPIIIENESDKPIGAQIADYAGMAELGGYATQLIPSPWTRIGGGITAALGGIGRTWGNYSADRLPLGSAIIETIGDVGFPILGIFAPLWGQARALKALQATKAAENATKGLQMINATKNAAKAVGRFGVDTGTNIVIAGAANYGLPGMVDSGTLNPMYGFDYLGDDLRHVTDFESPGARTRLFTTFGLPLLLPRLRKYNLVEDLKSSANRSAQPASESAPARTTSAPVEGVASNSSSAGAASAPTAGAAATGNPTSPSSMSAAEAFNSNSPVIAALLTAGGLGAASTASGKTTQNKSKSSRRQNKPEERPKTITGTSLPTQGLIIGTAGGLGAAFTASGKTTQNKSKSSKPEERPKTITGTYTGKPLPLTQGLIIGRKDGGKVGLLKELRK